MALKEIDLDNDCLNNIRYSFDKVIDFIESCNKTQLLDMLSSVLDYVVDMYCDKETSDCSDLPF